MSGPTAGEPTPAEPTTDGTSIRQKRCRACRAKIERDARVCPECSSYQNRYWYLMQASGHLALVVTLVIAVAPWILNQTAAAYDRWWGRDSLQVISFSDPGPIYVLNDGTRDVYVTAAYMRSPDLSDDEPGFSNTRPMGLLVKPGAIERDVRAVENEGDRRVIHSPDDSFDLRSHSLSNPCIAIRYKSESDPTMVQIRQSMGTKLATWPGEAVIRYRASGREGVAPVAVTVTATINVACREDFIVNGLGTMFGENTTGTPHTQNE